MSRFTEALRDVGIFNLHNLTQDGHPWIQVNPAQARSPMAACAAVHIKGRAFKDVPWYAHGARLFGYYGKEDKAEAIQKALDLTAKLFLISRWSKVRGGGLGCANTVWMQRKRS